MVSMRINFLVEDRAEPSINVAEPMQKFCLARINFSALGRIVCIPSASCLEVIFYIFIKRMNFTILVQNLPNNRSS